VLRPIRIVQKLARQFSVVVGGLNALVFEESEQPSIVLQQSRGEIADLAVGLSECRSAKAEIRFRMGIERSSSGPRSIQPPRNLRHVEWSGGLGHRA